MKNVHTIKGTHEYYEYLRITLTWAFFKIGNAHPVDLNCFSGGTESNAIVFHLDNKDLNACILFDYYHNFPKSDKIHIIDCKYDALQ